MSAPRWGRLPGGLRDLTAADGVAIAAAYRDDEICRWLPVPRGLPPEAYGAWADEAAALRASGDGLRLAIEWAGGLAGSIEVRRVDRRARSCELSYWSVPDRRRTGGTAAAVRTLADHLVTSADFRRVELRIAPGNAASLALARRAGFVPEGTLRRAGFLGDGSVVDLTVWSRTDRDVGR
ncbi:GNAT family N-acetyltransferase [Curtobacterium sp. ODYSSEY 48 V2]|uniref:GNAT family N-acetyltransferase n=1 Tax=Curtobacterium sp. ODYSSEY 48 V2 TaxID=2939561 RepID=UPI00203F0E34|nr:GNAT family protein [Curtobacterium sp. ODYSSEY 48 V2]MCM3504582.1 GNAT family N-acetyltransferase [Curtobacterium sp. ODYSSEY 48 V2]